MKNFTKKWKDNGHRIKNMNKKGILLLLILILLNQSLFFSFLFAQQNNQKVPDEKQVKEWINQLLKEIDILYETTKYGDRMLTDEAALQDLAAVRLSQYLDNEKRDKSLDKTIIDAFLKALKKELNGETAYLIASSLGKHADKSILPELKNMLRNRKDKRDDTIARIIDDLVTQPEEIEDVFEEFLFLEEFSIFPKLKYQKAIPYLISIATTTKNSIYTRERALSALRMYNDTELDEIVISIVEKCNSEEKRKLGLVVGGIKDKRIIPILEPLLNDKDEEIQVKSAEILSGMRDEKLNVVIFPVAAKLFRNRSWWIRWRAVVTLKNIGDDKSISLIREAANDKEDEVRQTAVEFLKTLEEKNKK